MKNVHYLIYVYIFVFFVSVSVFRVLCPDFFLCICAFVDFHYFHQSQRDLGLRQTSVQAKIYYHKRYNVEMFIIESPMLIIYKFSTKIKWHLLLYLSNFFGILYPFAIMLYSILR